MKGPGAVQNCSRALRRNGVAVDADASSPLALTMSWVEDSCHLTGTCIDSSVDVAVVSEVIGLWSRVNR